jgi:hypothetical protein
MKVKIKQDGKSKEFKLISNWEDVTLETWLELLKFSDKTRSKEAEEIIAALSNIPKELIKKMAIKDVAVIMGKISEMQHKGDNTLKKIITIEGKEYGFHPNLDEITLGEYADLEEFIKNDVDKFLPEIVAVLFRPVTKREKDIYEIEAYDGKINVRAELMKKMSAQQVQNALVFFYSFVKILLIHLEWYSTEVQKETKKQ